MKWLSSMLMAAAVFHAHVQAAEPTPASQREARGTAGEVKSITVAEFEALRAKKTNIVLDVRTPREFARGHIPGAVNIDFNAPDFDKKIKALDPDKTYLVHCAVGGRSYKACQKLDQMNFLRAYNLEGGIKAWEKEGNKPIKR